MTSEDRAAPRTEAGKLALRFFDASFPALRMTSDLIEEMRTHIVEIEREAAAPGAALDVARVRRAIADAVARLPWVQAGGGSVNRRQVLELIDTAGATPDPLAAKK